MVKVAKSFWFRLGNVFKNMFETRSDSAWDSYRRARLLETVSNETQA